MRYHRGNAGLRCGSRNPYCFSADDLGADSLAAVELVMALEEAAGISIAEEDAANLKTVGDIMTYLAAHKN